MRHTLRLSGPRRPAWAAIGAASIGLTVFAILTVAAFGLDLDRRLLKPPPRGIVTPGDALGASARLVEFRPQQRAF